MTRQYEASIRCDADGCDQSAKATDSCATGTMVQLITAGWRISRKADLCPTHAPSGGVTR